MIYDDETLEVESIPITGFREYKEFVIEKQEHVSDILKIAEEEKNNGHVVRIKNVSGEKVDEDISNEILLIEKKEIDVTNRGIEITQTREEQLKKYLEIKLSKDEAEQVLQVETVKDQFLMMPDFILVNDKQYQLDRFNLVHRFLFRPAQSDR